RGDVAGDALVKTEPGEEPEGPGQPPLAVAAFLLGGRKDRGARQAPDRRPRGGQSGFAHEQIPSSSGELVGRSAAGGPQSRRGLDVISIWLPLHMKMGSADCQAHREFFRSAQQSERLPRAYPACFNGFGGSFQSGSLRSSRQSSSSPLRR